jgi:hypothetical protein
VVAGWDFDDYEAMEQNLEGLTTDIPDMSIEEVPRRYQCHTVGMFISLSQLSMPYCRQWCAIMRDIHDTISSDICDTIL